MHMENDNKNLTRADFGLKLRGHDWFFGYSDDHRVYTKGRHAQSMLQKMHNDFECPYSMVTLRLWAHNMILENFAEEAPGEWYPNPRRYKSIAPTKREGLITQAYHDEITQWMILGATAEDISKIV